MATAKKAAEKTTTDATETAKAAIASANERATEATKSVTNMVSAFTEGSRKAVNGIVEVDKALFGYAGSALKSYVELGRQSMSAKSVNDLLDLHVAYAHDRIEQTAANTREVIDLAQRKAQEAYEPIKDAFEKAADKEETAA